jgi:hypothetical protein
MNTPFLIGIVVLVAAIVVVLRLHFLRQMAALREKQVENDVRQVMLETLVGDLRGALADESLALPDVERITAALIGQMQAYNVDGQLDAFIADNEASVTAALDARRVRGA